MERSSVWQQMNTDFHRLKQMELPSVFHLWPNFFCTNQQPALNKHMAEHNEPEKIWDEYDWERFLQQQDRKTERYMELLEKYIDDPNRDQIIAREMGWSHLLSADGEKGVEEVDDMFDDERDEAHDEEEEEGEEGGRG